MTLKSFATGLALLFATVTLSCRHVMPERNIDYHKGRVPVSLPREIRNSETDPNIDRPNAIVISISDHGRFYVGTDQSPLTKDDLRGKLDGLLADEDASETLVYLAASGAANYGTVVEVCDLIVARGFFRAGLLVHRVGYNTTSRLTVELERPPEITEDIRIMKPNPLTLVASISPDLKVKLNQENMGSVNDLSRLSEMLARVFRQRAEQFVYKPGLETRTDLPEDERLEKTLTVKAPKSIRYGDVVKVIDAAKSAGANPVILQLHDLAP